MFKQNVRTPSIIIGMIILLFFCQCKRTDYSLKTKWIYINDTDSIIHYSPDRVDFNLDAKDTVIFEYNTDASKEVTSSELVPPLRPYIIYYGTAFCDTICSPGLGPNEGEGPLGIANYEIQKIKNNDFVCTFHFTDSMVKKAGFCGP